METPTTSAPRPRLLAFYPYDVKPKKTDDCIEFTALWDGEYLATADKIQAAIDIAIDDFKVRSRPLLNRLKDPEIKITFSIR